MSISKRTQINISPRLQALVNALKKPDILSIVFAEESPGFLVTLHAFPPEVRALVLKFATAGKIPPEVIKLIRIKLKGATAELESVQRLVWRWWFQSMNGESRIDFFDIERITVVSHYVGRSIENCPEIPKQGAVAVLLGNILGVINYAMGLDRFFIMPLDCETQDISIALDPNSIGFVQGPDGS